MQVCRTADLPAFAMIERTSAKSTLMSPGTVMMSLMLCSTERFFVSGLQHNTITIQA
jgi:hypothetical protein